MLAYLFAFILALLISALYYTLLHMGSLFNSSLILIFFLICIVEIKYRAPARRKAQKTIFDALKLDQFSRGTEQVDVYLTSLDDQQAVIKMILEFKESQFCRDIIVVDNGSVDDTISHSLKLGAKVLVEQNRGYGQVIYRILKEGSLSDIDWFVICEGDGTYTAADLDKLMAYRSSAPIVNGTRIVEQLRDELTQLTDLIFWGNFFAAKLLELKHFGRGTFTDLGTTYKLVNRKAINMLVNDLNPRINLEFNAHFLDKALSRDLLVVEVPINFRKRLGQSKGGNSSIGKAAKTGFRMIFGILFWWPK